MDELAPQLFGTAAWTPAYAAESPLVNCFLSTRFINLSMLMPCDADGGQML